MGIEAFSAPGQEANWLTYNLSQTSIWEVNGICLEMQLNIGQICILGQYTFVCVYDITIVGCLLGKSKYLCFRLSKYILNRQISWESGQKMQGIMCLSEKLFYFFWSWNCPASKPRDTTNCFLQNPNILFTNTRKIIGHYFLLMRLVYWACLRTVAWGHWLPPDLQMEFVSSRHANRTGWIQEKLPLCQQTDSIYS